MKPVLTDLPVAILAGGLATRLLPVTATIPKVLVDVAGRPFLDRQLAYLRGQGFSRVVLCLGHLAHRVQEMYGDEAAGVQIQYSLDGPTLLGTGGAIRTALPMLGSEFLVLYGDSYLPVDFGEVVTAFRRDARPALMTVYRNRDQWDASNVFFESGEIRDYNKRVRSPRMEHIDYGLMAFRCSVFSRYPPGHPIDLADVLTDLVGRKELAGFEVFQRFYEIGSHKGLAELSRFLGEPPA